MASARSLRTATCWEMTASCSLVRASWRLVLSRRRVIGVAQPAIGRVGITMLALDLVLLVGLVESHVSARIDCVVLADIPVIVLSGTAEVAAAHHVAVGVDQLEADVGNRRVLDIAVVVVDAD